jgi:hypothetical protein
MEMPMRRSPILALAFTALAAGAAGCAVQATPIDSHGTITVDNASSHVLTEIRVAPVDQVDWGPNLLRDVLYPDEQLTISVACDNYDVLVSDDRGRQCVLGDLDLCFSDSLWTIDDATLHSCGF